MSISGQQHQTADSAEILLPRKPLAAGYDISGKEIDRFIVLEHALDCQSMMRIKRYNFCLMDHAPHAQKQRDQGAFHNCCQIR